jgi:hypothetical protein
LIIKAKTSCEELTNKEEVSPGSWTTGLLKLKPPERSLTIRKRPPKGAG